MRNLSTIYNNVKNVTYIYKVYEEGVLKLSLHCAKEAAKHGVNRFIEVSTGQIYAGDKVSSLIYLCLLCFLPLLGYSSSI